MTEPSSAEIMRTIDGIVRRLDTITATLETGYVRRDTHESAMKATEAMHLAGIRLIETQMQADRSAAERTAAENAQDIKDVRAESQRGLKDLKVESQHGIADLKADRAIDTAWKRQVTAIGISALLGMVVTFAVAIFNLLTGG